MNVTVVGTGYVGLVTGCCLAKTGHTVVCVDKDSDKIAAMLRGEVQVYEPGLAEIMRSCQKNNQLHFTTDLKQSVEGSDVIFLALPTPAQQDGSADLSAVIQVAKQLALCLPAHYCLVVVKSTVPVGTAEKVHGIIAKKAHSPFHIVANPEFLREGRAVKDFMEPERIVIGTDSDKAEAIMRRLYAPLIGNKHPLYVTDARTAELIKYAANAFLVTKVNFMNEIAQLCERLGADVDSLRQAIGADSRIGNKYLYPGIGFGGSCFPKDVQALKHMADEQGYEFKLLEAAMDINLQQQRTLVDKLLNHFGNSIRGKTIALWGLAFKPFTDDIRDAPSLVIINGLLEADAKVVAYDPEAAEHVRKRYSGNDKIVVLDNKYAALRGADALLVATEWPEFVEADLTKIKQALTAPLVLDGRNIFHPVNMKKAGFTYYSIGRPPVMA